MPQSPNQILQLFHNQTRGRLIAFLAATAVALIAAIAFKYLSESNYPPLNVGILVHGLIFWPWLLLKGSKGVNAVDAIKAYKETKK
ncbi:MAG: hypothetical protein GY847_05555 [Proteobacteria bacterium]|nr:hypothetical protein [Pseudomonadota bacterium]